MKHGTLIQNYIVAYCSEIDELHISAWSIYFFFGMVVFQSGIVWITTETLCCVVTQTHFAIIAMLTDF